MVEQVKDVLALIDVLASLRVLHSIPWRCIQSMDGRKGLAAVATLLGAGMMGAMVLVKGALPWLVSAHGSAPQVPRRELLCVPGLHNSGNNCFLNAVLQAMSSSKKFTSYFASCPLSSCTDDLPVSAALFQLLQELTEVRPERCTISPRRIMVLLSNHVQNFDLGSQQDAAEALSHIASAVQQERMEDFEERKPNLQSFAKAPSLTPLNSMKEGVEDKLELECWRQQLRWPLEGTLGSLLVCSKCGFQASTQFHFFRDIPLPLPEVANGSAWTIEDSLHRFAMLERVSNVTCNRCTHRASVQCLSPSASNKDLIKVLQNCNYEDDCQCKSLTLQHGELWQDVHNDAFKCLKVGRCPEVICLHIQRVRYNEVGSLEKLSDHISFPMELDLYPYTIAAWHERKQNRPECRPFLSSSLPAAPQALGSDLMMSLVGPKCVGGDASSMDYQLELELQQRQASRLDEQTATDMEIEEEPVGSGTNQELDGLQSDCGSANTARKQIMYRLCSVVVHHGGVTSGHYTVYRKVQLPREEEEMVLEDEVEDCDGSVWFQISDAQVSRVSREEVFAAKASLLFYELQQSGDDDGVPS